MEDIIEIYEPIYRETSKVIPIAIIIIISVIIFLGIFFLIKYVKKRKSIITTEQKYKKCLENFLCIQSNIDSISTHDFASDVSLLYKEYITELYFTDFRHTTAEEMAVKLRSLDDENDLIFDLFLNTLEPCQFGKLHINTKDKNDVIKACVDDITIKYNKKVNLDD